MLSKFEKYCIFHQLIGQTFLLSNKFTKSMRVLGWFIFLLNITITILCTKELSHHVSTQFKASNFFVSMFASVTIFPILFAMLANIRSPHRNQLICDALLEVLKDVEVKFHLTNVQRVFWRLYNKKIAWIFASFSIYAMSRIFIVPKHISRPLDIAYCVLNFQIDCLILQCVFYADSIKLILNVLGRHIIKVMRSRKLNVNQKMHILTKLKWMHLSLWEIMKCINAHFGWTLIAILFDAFTNLLRMIYLQFMDFHNFTMSAHDYSKLHITRKYPQSMFFYYI